MADGQMNASAATGGGTGSARAQSTISFPYIDLENALTVAKTMLDAGGVPVSREQLGAAMGQSIGSGNFVTKVAAARMFGLIESVQGKYVLTDLGHEILDPGRERAARVRAFLTVPLYKKTYEEFRGKMLPPRPLGLETAFVRFGVAEKQKDRARIAFEKSASQAGFFSGGNERLVEPIVGPYAPPSAADAPADLASQKMSEPTASMVIDNELIRGLFKQLPAPGTVWSDDGQSGWLRLADNIFNVIYKKAPKDGGQGQGS